MLKSKCALISITKTPLYNSDYSLKPINNCINGVVKHTNASVSAFDHTKHSVTALVGRPLALQNTLRSDTQLAKMLSI